MPQDNHTRPGLIPYLIVEHASEAIAFYIQAMGATEHSRLVMPDGRVGHAELSVAGARFMLADEFPEQDCIGPLKRGGATCSFGFQVEDVDALVARAVHAGATLERPIKNEFYGERVGWIRDPFGQRWSFHQQVETLSPQEIQMRFEALQDG